MKQDDTTKEMRAAELNREQNDHALLTVDGVTKFWLIKNVHTYHDRVLVTVLRPAAFERPENPQITLKPDDVVKVIE